MWWRERLNATMPRSDVPDPRSLTAVSMLALTRGDGAVARGAVRRWVVVRAVALALLLALATLQPVAAQTPTVHPDRAAYRWGQDLGDDDRTQIAAGFKLAQRWLPDVHPFVVRAGDRVRPPGVGTRGPYSYDYVASAGGNTIEVYSSGDAYRDSSPNERTVTMVHEYYHLVQEDLMGRRRPEVDAEEPFVPLWLVEGSAEYVSMRVGRDVGIVDFAQVRAGYVDAVKASQVPLERFNNPDDEDDDEASDPYEDDPYSMGFLATELLATRYGGEAAVLRFWELAGSEGDWRVAFRRAFGASAGRFVREFAKWRTAGFPQP